MKEVTGSWERGRVNPVSDTRSARSKANPKDVRSQEPKLGMRPVGGSFGCPTPATLGGDRGEGWQTEGTDLGCPKPTQA